MNTSFIAPSPHLFYLSYQKKKQIILVFIFINWNNKTAADVFAVFANCACKIQFPLIFWRDMFAI